ncbi:hypothetical protein ABW20_dc0106981 [Dactylellina cionopaga]|nr:hypothetical protein ABW20_dc0106981 [Dactylellina cionopaga]
MPRTAQLLVSRTAKPDVPAHWSLYIPYSSSLSVSSQDIGKLIHVVGSPLHGFTLELRASYLPSEDSIKRVPFTLCLINDGHVKDTEYYTLRDGSKKTIVMGTELEGNEDEVERIAMKVEAPGKMKGWNPLVPAKVGVSSLKLVILWYTKN